MARTTLEIPMNRVEGDLEIRAVIEDGVVVDAFSCGTMFRGFENMLRGRGALDGLVITPRVCGICSTSHLVAAARALDGVAGIEPTMVGRLVREIALGTETVQSDLRQALLMYAPDFAGRAHEAEPLYAEAVRRHQPFRGASVVEAIRATKHLLEIIAILGGQWPHSSFAVPGGVVTSPSHGEPTRARHILSTFRAWYEEHVLGCTIERFAEVTSVAALDAWLDEKREHQEGDLGFVLRYGRAIGLDRIGRGHARFLSTAGVFAHDPADRAEGGDEVRPLDQARITEDVSRSWAAAHEGARHPFEGETQPYASGREGERYSWAKAARYDGRPHETGALAAMLVARDPLFVDLLARSRTAGPHALARVLARMVRPARMIPALDASLATLAVAKGPACPSRVELREGRGYGLVEAPRGVLGHWVELQHGKIAHYQIITPTGWNGSPRDASGARGPWEEALVGTRLRDPASPVELGYVVRSFDPCLVCTVHATPLRGAGKGATLRIGAGTSGT
jgi:hydrogenase large subunit